MLKESNPFSSGTEYEIFQHNYCKSCRKYVVRDDGFPALVEDGGCPVLDAMEYARFDMSVFPCKKIVKVVSNDGEVIREHHCIDYVAN